MNVTVGIVGFGYSGRTIHAPLIRAAGMCVRAIVSSRAEMAASACPDARVFGSLGALLESDDADLVVITTPNHLHVAQAIACLRAGRHVVIDKPAALDCAQFDELMAVAKSCDRKIAVFHNRRWDSDFLTVERLLNTQGLGEISSFESRWDRFRPQVPARWRENRDHGGGLLLDLGPHMVDQALRLFGRPHWVQASVIAQRTGATVDDAFEILMARGALLVKLGASSLAPAPAPRFRVNGIEGTFVKTGLDVQEQQLRDGGNPLTVDFGCEPASQFGTVTAAQDAATRHVTAERGCWTEFYRLVRASIESNAPVPVPLEEAREVGEVLDAARRSSSEGRRVVLSKSPS
jgi:scyllo-inositol 2-dehydrogenase (NADP+)